MIRRVRRDSGEAEVMRKGIEKGSKEKIEKRKIDKIQFEEKEGLRDPTFLDLAL